MAREVVETWRLDRGAHDAIGSRAAWSQLAQVILGLWHYPQRGFPHCAIWEIPLGNLPAQRRGQRGAR